MKHKPAALEPTDPKDRINNACWTCLAVATFQEIAMAIEMDSLTDRNQRKILLSLYLPRLWQWWAAIPCTLLSLDICAVCFPQWQCWSSNRSIYRIVYTYVQCIFEIIYCTLLNYITHDWIINSLQFNSM